MVRETNKKIMVILTVLLVSITCFFATEIAYAGDDTTISGDYEYFANEDGTNGIPVVTLTIDPEEFNKVIESKDHSYKLNMDQELTDALCMITFVEDDETVKTVEIHRDGLLSVSDLPEDPESDGLIFAGWKDSEGIAASDEYQVTQDTVFTADFVRKEESVEPNYLFFSQYDAWVDLREQTFQNIVYLLPADTQYRTITWTLSDQDPADAEIAEINKAGKVTVIQPGEVTVTATAKNGMSNSYRLHIFDSNVTPWHMPESIIPESDQLTLEVGDYEQMPITISPQPIVYDIVYYSSDKEVATVNDDGVIKALAPGTATITIYGDNNTTAQFKVIVRDTDLENPFSDVKDSDYFFNPVLWAVNHDPQITKGISSTIFSPDSTCRRCEVVTFLWRAFGAEKMTGETIFEDVETTDYFYDAAVWAVANGITNGTDETHFSPDDPCTREQVATFLWRACSRPDTVRLVSPFADVQNRESYSFTPVLWAYENGITTGTRANAFSPHDPCTRAQIVTFLFRALAEPLAPLEPDGRIHFQPKVASQYLVEVFGEEKVETWFNLVDAVMAGKDTFACPDKETYNWVMGQFPNKCFPAINPVRGLLIDYEWDRDNPVKDGVGRFTYLVPREEAAAKIEEFSILVEDILNESMKPDYSDFEKALSLYLYFQETYIYDDEAAEDNKNGRADYVSSYRFLTGKSGICHEISTAYSYLLMQAGVDATTVMSFDHEWSFVRLKGKNYHIDPTFALSEYRGDLCYFLMNDEIRCKDGMFQAEGFTYCSNYSRDHPHPDYTATENTFGEFQNGYFDSFDHEKQLMFYVRYGDFGESIFQTFNYQGV